MISPEARHNLIPNSEWVAPQRANPIESNTRLHSIDLFEGLFKIKIDEEKEVKFTPRNGKSVSWMVFEYIVNNPGSSDYEIRKHLEEYGHTSNAKSIVDGIRIRINKEYLHSANRRVGTDIVLNEGTHRKPSYRINANINRIPYVAPEAIPATKDTNSKPTTEAETEAKDNISPLRKVKNALRKNELDAIMRKNDALSLERLGQNISFLFLSRILAGTNPNLSAVSTADNAKDVITDQIQHPDINSERDSLKKENTLKRLFPEDEYGIFILNSVLNSFGSYLKQRPNIGGSNERIAQICYELKSKGITRADILSALSSHLELTLTSEQQAEASQAKKRIRPLLHKPKTAKETNPRPEGNKNRN